MCTAEGDSQTNDRDPTGRSASLFDVTHGATSHAQLAAVLRHAQIGIGVVSEGDLLLVANAAFYSILGIVPQPSDAQPSDLYFSTALPAGKWPIDRVLLGGEQLTGEKIEIQLPDGRALSLLLSAAPLLDAWSVPVAVVTIMDVTSAQARRNTAFESISDTKGGERRRLALELHDDLGQLLTLLSLELRALQFMPAPTEWSRRVSAAQDMVQNLSQRVHEIAWSLRPMVLDQFGLRAALDDLVASFAQQLTIPVDTWLDEVPDSGIPVDAADALYRITQEALTNIAKHSNATKASVTAHRKSASLRIAIEDNGHGFIPGIGFSGMGLMGMQERLALVGGQLTIESSPANGVTIFAEVPIQTQ